MGHGVGILDVFAPTYRYHWGQDMIGRPNITESRGDISRFMVHLTRDDTGEWANGGGDTARENFLAIYNERTILAPKAHCLHAKKVPLPYRKKFHVACFSEMPLTEIQHVTQHIRGRQVQLEPYGFVFRRDFMLSAGAQQVTYVNSHADNPVREAYDMLFEMYAKRKFNGKAWKSLPFVSALHERCDFSWEREWRVLGELNFNYSDLVCVVLPDEKMGPFKVQLAQNGVTWISPNWGYERMLEELSDQQDRTRRLKLPPVRRRGPAKSIED